MEIRVTLRSGNTYLLLLDDDESDAERVFTELAAGRSQALRGWVPVTSEQGGRIVVRGDEVLELHLVDEDP
jgi:hypothetical protein